MQASRASVTLGDLVVIEGTLPNAATGVLKRAGAFQSETGWCCMPADWARIEGLLRGLGIALDVAGEAVVPATVAPAYPEGRKAFLSYLGRQIRIQGHLPKPMEKHWLGSERSSGHVGMSPWAVEEFLTACAEQRIVVEMDAAVQEMRESLQLRRQVIEVILEAPVAELPDVALKTSTLNDEQRRALAFIQACNGRAFIADAVGGRKTTTAIGWKRYSDAKRIVVVAPATVKGNWHEEIGKFDGGLAMVLDGFRDPGTPPPHPTVQWLVTGFDTLFDQTRKEKTYRGWLEYLKAWKPDLVVVDESHVARGDGGSDRSQAMQAIAHAVPHALLLTATPQSNSAMDRWSQLTALEPGWWGTWFEFGLGFCNGQKRTRYAGKKRWDYWDMDGVSNADVLKQRMQYVVLSRDRETLGTAIPSERIPVYFDLENREEYEKQHEEYRQVLDAERAEQEAAENAEEVKEEGLAPGGGMYLSKRMKFILKLRQISSKGRVYGTLNLVQKLVKEGKRPVVFAYFVDSLEALRDGLRSRGLRVGYIRGGVSRPERDRIRQEFNSGALDVLVGQTEAAGVGINLHAKSDTTVTHELTYRPIDVIQTEGRVNRDGQTAPKTIHYYCMGTDTYDEKTLKILLRKMAANDAVEKGIEDELLSEIEADFFQAPRRRPRIQGRL